MSCPNFLASKQDLCVAAAYAFGIRFMDEAERIKILEVLRMTNLGEMLVMDAVMDAVMDERTEFAKKLLKRNTPIEIVVEDTGLDENTVLRIQAELQNK